MSGGQLYLISVGRQRLLVAADAVANIRRVRAGGADLAAMRAERGISALYDLADWLRERAPERRIALVVDVDGEWVGLLADALDDAVELDGPLEPLPALVRDHGHDPAAVAVALVAGVPRLMIELEQVARSRRAAAGALA